MANTSSAKKAQRVASRRRVFNLRRQKTMKDTAKEVAKLIVGHKAKEAEAMLPALYMAVDKAAKNGVIKKNTAARMKSRLTKRIAHLAK